jgi:hypothetical protein
MANRYWVGGTGTWNASSTTNWSATSGGASGASVPTAADVAIFDQAATYTVTISGTGTRAALAITNTAGTVTFAGTATLQLGGLTLAAAAVWSRTANIQFTIAGTHTIDTNGVTIQAFGITFESSTAVWTLGSDFTTGTSTTLSFIDGVLDLNGNTLTTYFCFLYPYDAGLDPTTPELVMTSGTLRAEQGVLMDALPWPSATIPTITGPGTIELFGDLPDTLFVGWLTSNPPDPADTRVAAFPTVQHTGAAPLVVYGTNTFTALESGSLVGAVTFVAGTTNTFGTFDISGGPGALKTLTAESDGYTAATQATLLKSTPWFVGANSVDDGNNTGLIFTAGGINDYLAISNIIGGGSGTTYATDVIEGVDLSDAAVAAEIKPASVQEAVEAQDATAVVVSDLVWSEFDDSQTPNWQNVDNTQAPTWTPVDDSQTPGWTPVTP